LFDFVDGDPVHYREEEGEYRRESKREGNTPKDTNCWYNRNDQCSMDYPKDVGKDAKDDSRVNFVFVKGDHMTKLDAYYTLINKKFKDCCEE